MTKKKDTVCLGDVAEIGWKSFCELQARDLIASKYFFWCMNDFAGKESRRGDGDFLFLTVVDSANGRWRSKPYLTHGVNVDDYRKLPGKRLEVEIPVKNGRIKKSLPAGHSLAVRDQKCFIIRLKDPDEFLPCYLQSRLEQYLFSEEGKKKSGQLGLIVDHWVQCVEKEKRDLESKLGGIDASARQHVINKMCHNAGDYMARDLSQGVGDLRGRNAYSSIHQSLDQRLFEIEQQLGEVVGDCLLSKIDLEKQYEESFPIVECDSFDSECWHESVDGKVKHFKIDVRNSGQQRFGASGFFHYCENLERLGKLMDKLREEVVLFSSVRESAALLGCDLNVSEVALGSPYLNKADYRDFLKYEIHMRGVGESSVPQDELEKRLCLESCDAAEALVQFPRQKKLSISPAVKLMEAHVASSIPSPKDDDFMRDYRNRIVKQRPDATPEEIEEADRRAKERAEQEANRCATALKVLMPEDRVRQLMKDAGVEEVVLGELLTFEQGVSLKDVRAGDLIFKRTLVGDALDPDESPFVSIFEPIKRIKFEIPSMDTKELKKRLPARPGLRFEFSSGGTVKEQLFEDIGPFDRWESLVIYEKAVDVLRLNLDELERCGVLPGYLYYVLEQEENSQSWNFADEMLKNRQIPIPSLAIQNRVLEELYSSTGGFLIGDDADLPAPDVSWGREQYAVVNEILGLVSEPQISVSAVNDCFRKMWKECEGGAMHKRIGSRLSEHAFPLYGDGNALGGFYERVERAVGDVCGAIRTFFGPETCGKEDRCKPYKYAQSDLSQFEYQVRLPSFRSESGSGCIDPDKPVSIFQLVVSTPFYRVYDWRDLLSPKLTALQREVNKIQDEMADLDGKSPKKRDELLNKIDTLKRELEELMQIRADELDSFLAEMLVNMDKKDADLFF